MVRKKLQLSRLSARESRPGTATVRESTSTCKCTVLDCPHVSYVAQSFNDFKAVHPQFLEFAMSTVDVIYFATHTHTHASKLALLKNRLQLSFHFWPVSTTLGWHLHMGKRLGFVSQPAAAGVAIIEWSHLFQ
eukprot:1691396-Amphidinium_carterae.1